MMACVWPLATVRSTPLRISMGASSVITETCRSRICRVAMVFRNSSSGADSSKPIGKSDADDGEFALDGGRCPLDDRRHAELQQHLTEEAADDQATGDRLRDTPGEQVEQLLVVEPAGGAGVPGPDDLAGLDLQVRHRVGAGTLGEQQV